MCEAPIVAQPSPRKIKMKTHVRFTLEVTLAFTNDLL